MGVDFSLLYPAGKAILTLDNPYLAAPHFYNPPWMLILLAPIGLLPMQIGRWIWMLLGMVGYFVAFQRLNFSKFSTVILFMSPFVYFDLGIGNYEWLILLGTTLPIVYGSWVAFLKPQMSIWWIALQVKQGKLIAVLPVVLLGILFITGLFALPSRGDMPWSRDIFPYGIPVGLFLLYIAFKKEDSLIALAAAPFLSPYVAMQSWIFAFLPFARIKNKFILVGSVLVSWILVYFFAQ